MCAAILVSASFAVANLVGPGSDGRAALAAIRGRSPVALTGDIANTLGRWMALYANARDPRFSDQRRFLFGIAPLELGVDPRTSFDDASRYWNAARAGWCWREVRPAPADVLADLPKSAWRNQSLEALHGLELAGAAAAEVARHDGRDQELDVAFMATTELREGSASADDDSRFAFQFGVALHDVERVMAQQGQRYW